MERLIKLWSEVKCKKLYYSGYDMGCCYDRFIIVFYLSRSLGFIVDSGKIKYSSFFT